MTMTTIRLPDELLVRVAALADATGRSTNDVMTEALIQYVAHEESDEDGEGDVTHEDLMAEWVARGLLQPEDLDAPDPMTLEEYHQAQA